MPMKKLPGKHPRVEDLNRIYGARHVRKLATAHRRLGHPFRVGDHVEHVPGIASEDIRYWRAHMRAMPELARKLLQYAIDHHLRATPPRPIRWIIKDQSRAGWSVAVSDRGGRVTIEVVPPLIRSPLSRRKRSK